MVDWLVKVILKQSSISYWSDEGVWEVEQSEVERQSAHAQPSFRNMDSVIQTTSGILHPAFSLECRLIINKSFAIFG